MIVSTNAVETYLRCPVRFYFTYVKRIEPVPSDDGKKSIALEFGVALHEALRTYFSDGEEMAIRRLEDFELTGRVKSLSTAKILLRKEIQNLKGFTPIVWEKPFRIPLMGHTWIGRFDLIATKDGVPFVIDFKTTTDGEFQIRPNNQVMSYWLAAKNLYSDVGGVYVHLLKASTQTVINYLVTPTYDEEMEWLDETSTILNQMERSIRLEEWTKNPKGCWMWGRPCEFLPLCQSFGRVRESLLKNLYRPSERRSIYED